MKYSIIIPTYDNVCDLYKCIESIRKYSKGCETDYEIIVVLDGLFQKHEGFLQEYSDKVILTDNDSGFAKSVNKGIKHAEGDYIVLLNDDTLVSPEWLQRLEKGLSIQSSKPVTIVAPTSNYAVGQIQQTKSSVNEHNYIQYCDSLSQSDHFSGSGIISGFCMMLKNVPSDWWADALGNKLLDEQFNNGCEDIDLCINNFIHGNLCVVNTNLFIYHKGSVTIDKHFPELDRGNRNHLNLVRKWAPYFTRPQKVAAVYRISLQTDTDVDMFKQSVLKTQTLVDDIFVIDNNSLGGGAAFNKICIFDKLGIKNVRHYSRDNDDRIDRKELIDWVRDEGYEWIMSLEHDEIFEDSCTRKDIQRLIHNPSPLVHCYTFPIYSLWNNLSSWRKDNIFGKLHAIKLGRVTPKSEESIDCVDSIPSVIPITPADFMSHSTLRINHHGFLNKELREDSFNSLEKSTEKMLTEDNANLFKSSAVSLCGYKSDNSIDVCTIMKNEETNLLSYMTAYYSIGRDVILVDTGSTDNSVELAQLLGAKVIERHDINNNLAEMRNEYLNISKSTWIFQVDLDESCDSLYMISRLLNSSISNWMFRIHNYRQGVEDVCHSETIRLFKNTNGLNYKGRVHEILDISDAYPENSVEYAPFILVNRGFLGNTDAIRSKVTKYYDQCIQRIQDNPADAQALHGIALHLMDDGRRATASLLFEAAIKYSPSWYLPIMDNCVNYMWRALYGYKDALEILPRHHPSRESCEKGLKILSSLIGKRPALVEGITKQHSDDFFNKILDLTSI